MLLRICLIVAILAGLGAGGVAYYEFSTQIPQLKDQRDKEKDQKVAEISLYNKTAADLKKTNSVLVQTTQDLADTKSELTKAVARADAQSKRADDLATKLAKTTADLEDTGNRLAAYTSSELSPDQVVKLNKNLKEAQVEIAAINTEKSILQRKLVATQAELDKFIGENPFVKLPADLKGKVVVVDPKWDFVVLDVGGDKGAVTEGEMLVSRNGKLVAKVILRTVEEHRSIANIIPGWKLGDVIEGDIVTPAHPQSS